MARPKIEARLKDLLDEARLAMLGSQLLLGLQYRAAFSAGFDSLPPPFIALDGVALLLIMTGVALLLAIPAMHHINEAGHATGYIIARASTYLQAALFPLACTLGIDIAIGLASTLGATAALATGLIFCIVAWGAWYGVPLLVAERSQEDTMEDKTQSLEARLIQGLTELRVILPGAQALFGFQFTAVLTDSFQQLPAASKAVHLASMALVAVTIIMLIAPAAYHRLAAKGNAEQRVLSYTTRMMLCAVGQLALGLVGDAYVTVGKISGMPMLASGVATAAFIGFAVLLYGIPLHERSRRWRAHRGGAYGDSARGIQ
jgi:Family of unknown function (DUF6328)